MENTQQNPTKEKIKLDFKDANYATGKRKTSIAKIWLKKGSGKIFVNGKNYEDYFKRANHKMQLLRPFEILNQSTSYDVKCNVKGGGLSGQVGAIIHGISRALVEFEPALKPTLKKEKLTAIPNLIWIFQIMVRLIVLLVSIRSRLLLEQ